MVYIHLKEILQDEEDVNSFITFRAIEDWCTKNVPLGRWRFDYRSMINAYGVDVPIKVIFHSDIDATIFVSLFCKDRLK